MLVVTIDLGTYSLKILESRVEKKKVKHFNKFELKLSQDKLIEKVNEVHEKISQAKNDKEKELKIDEALPFLELQVNLLNDYLEKIPENSKILVQAPREFVSSRFLNIPISNKKKAELMVPFQIEDDIPFKLNDVLLSKTMTKVEKSYDTLASIIETKTFNPYYEYFKQKGAHLTYMTTEVDAWNSYLKSIPLFEDQDCVIIDMGHSGSRFYFYSKTKLISYCNSSFGGKAINEMLMTEYNVEIDKATEFKHKNSFYLTPEQYGDVDEKQREFAQKMHETTKPLIADFKRWALSLRVNHNVGVSKVYLSGGTSKIKNIENYLAQSLEKTVDFTKDWNNQFLSLPTERFEFLNLANANALSSFYLAKQSSNNFLVGDYAPSKSGDFPAHSISFVTLRAVFLALLVAGGFMTEKYFLDKSNQKLTKNLKGTISKPSLGLAKREVNSVNKRPDRILTKIQKQTIQLKKQIKTLEKDSNNNSLKGLFKMTSLVNTPCYLSNYVDTRNGEVEATFAGCDSQNIVELEKSLNKSGLQSIQMKSDPNQGTLKLNFKI